MASMVSVFILGSLAIAALVWCFLGFTRAMKEPPGLTGLLFSLHQDPRNTSKRNVHKRKAALLELPSFLPSHTGTAGRKRHEKIGKNR